MSAVSEKRGFALPGDPIASNVNVDPRSYLYVYKIDDTIYAAVPCMYEIVDNTLKVIPMEGVYVPRPGDIVIGLVINFVITHWQVDINSPYIGILHASNVLGRPYNPAKDELKEYLEIGDYVVAKIDSFDRTRDPVLDMRGKDLGRITEGKIIEIKPSRVPKVIGKKKSMLNVIKNDTNCDIVVGANGRIWVKCPNKDLEDIVALAIKLIEREAFLPGLTEKVRTLIANEKHERGLL